MSEPVKRLRDYLVVGVVAYVIGVVVMVLAWPHSSGAYGAQSGDTFFTVLGLLAASAGGGCALMALIGLGVKFGREAVDLDRTRA